MFIFRSFKLVKTIFLLKFFQQLVRYAAWRSIKCLFAGTDLFFQSLVFYHVLLFIVHLKVQFLQFAFLKMRFYSKSQSFPPNTPQLAVFLAEFKFCT